MTALAEELALPKYAALTDQECYDSLTLRDIVKTDVIKSITLVAKLELEDKWTVINDLDGTEPYYDTAYHIKLLLSTFDEFDMNMPEQVTVYTRAIDALVASSILTQPQVDEVTATGYPLITRVEELGITNYHLGYIAKARL